jgi:hypothetical protein
MTELCEVHRVDRDAAWITWHGVNAGESALTHVGGGVAGLVVWSRSIALGDV